MSLLLARGAGQALVALPSISDMHPCYLCRRISPKNIQLEQVPEVVNTCTKPLVMMAKPLLRGDK